ncbi:MAG: transposase family protein [Sedimenticola sp.]
MHSRHRKRPCIISPSNRLLMTLIWLRQYPVYAILALTFNVRKSVVCRTIHRTWLALYKHYAPNVRWPDRREWRRLARRWPDMPNIVAAIDGTSHEIQIPTNHQQLFYSGHRKFHCIHTQVRYVYGSLEK